MSLLQNNDAGYKGEQDSGPVAEPLNLEGFGEYSSKSWPNIAYWRRTRNLSMRAAVLAVRLQWLFAKATLPPNKHRLMLWMVQTDEQIAEATGQDERTIARARKDLIKAQLIIVTQHPFGGALRVSHYRPTDKFLHPFGVYVSDFDTVWELANVKTGRSKNGAAGLDKKITPEQSEALARWKKAFGERGQKLEGDAADLHNLLMTGD